MGNETLLVVVPRKKIEVQPYGRTVEILSRLQTNLGKNSWMRESLQIVI